MQDFERKAMKKELAALRAITKSCRDSMHEPDEQGISAVVTGDHLDNAGFESEFRVTLTKDHKGKTFTIDLASLIALARLAVIPDGN